MEMGHKALAMQTGIPKNYWDGVFQGSLVGAEVVDEQLETAKKERRLMYEDIFEDILRRWCELNGFAWKDTYKISWKQEEILTEREKAEVEATNAQAAATRVSAYITSAEEEREKMGLEGPAPEKPDMGMLGTINVNSNKKKKEDNPEEEAQEVIAE